MSLYCHAGWKRSRQDRERTLDVFLLCCWDIGRTDPFFFFLSITGSGSWVTKCTNINTVYDSLLTYSWTGKAAVLRFPHWALTQHFHVQLTLKQWQSDGNYVIHLRFEIIVNLHFCVHRNSNWRKQNDHYPVISLRTTCWYFTYLSPWQQGVRQVATTSGGQTSQSRLFWEWSFTNLLLLSVRLSGFDTNLLLNKTLYRLPALIPQSRLCCFLVWKRISVKFPPNPPPRCCGIAAANEREYFCTTRIS